MTWYTNQEIEFYVQIKDNALEGGLLYVEQFFNHIAQKGKYFKVYINFNIKRRKRSGQWLNVNRNLCLYENSKVNSILKL